MDGVELQVIQVQVALLVGVEHRVCLVGLAHRAFLDTQVLVDGQEHQVYQVGLEHQA